MTTLEAPVFWASLFQIIWIDIVLSGDNALVIAMACRHLPARYRRIGVFLGTGCAVFLRILFAGLIVYLLGVPYLKIIGAFLLLWIAIKLALPEGDSGHASSAEHKEGQPDEKLTLGALWGVVRTIIIADAVMSLDNVISVAAAAKGDFFLLSLGIGISIPLMVVGSSMMLWVLDRFPWLLLLGAGLLGWISGQLFLHDPVLQGYAAHPALTWGLPLGCALGVILLGFFQRKRA